jgi:N-acetylglutamate synthase-like GNAT family acetyltransferase
MTANRCNVRVATAADLNAVQAFYGSVGYSPAIDPANKILVAELEGHLVGALRLCEEHGVLVLRGMQVHRTRQRRGIGTQLLDFAITHMDRACFCLSFEHTVEFYRRAGFAPVPETELPPFLRERVIRYRGKGDNVVPMVRGMSPPRAST